MANEKQDVCRKLHRYFRGETYSQALEWAKDHAEEYGKIAVCLYFALKTDNLSESRGLFEEARRIRGKTAAVENPDDPIDKLKDKVLNRARKHLGELETKATNNGWQG